MPVIFAMLVVSKVPLLGRSAAKRVRPLLDVHLNFVEVELFSRQWFAGESFSAADIMMSFPLEAAHARFGLGASRPAIAAWPETIHSRPAYRRALERGGRYAFAL